MAVSRRNDDQVDVRVHLVAPHNGGTGHEILVPRVRTGA
jgi:hypothetical protein